METHDPRGGVEPSRHHGRDPTGPVAHSLSLSLSPSLSLSLSLARSLHPHVFLGGLRIEIDLRAASRRSNGHPQ